MKIKILKRTKTELRLEVSGEGHTFCNVVQEALLGDKNVDMAGYNVAHPLTASPIIYVRTRGQSKPEIVLRNSVREVQKETKAFETAFDKALKQWHNRNVKS